LIMKSRWRCSVFF